MYSFFRSENTESEGQLVRSSPEAMADLSIQFASLVSEQLNAEDAQLFEKFFDAFIGSFEEQDSVKHVFSQACNYFLHFEVSFLPKNQIFRIISPKARVL